MGVGRAWRGRNWVKGFEVYLEHNRVTGAFQLKDHKWWLGGLPSWWGWRENYLSRAK